MDQVASAAADYVAALRQDSNLREHPEISARKTNLTGTLLMAPGGIDPNVSTFMSTESAINESGHCDLVAVFRVGDLVSGHSGIVHGGLLATLLDEYLCRCGFAVLPHKVGVTAHLSIDYKLPTPANSCIVVKASTPQLSEGRKAWVSGQIYVLDKNGELGEPTMEAKLLAVEPKWYEKLIPLTSE